MSDKESESKLAVQKGVDRIVAHDAYHEQDGGAKAWISLVGAWLVLFATFGYLYSFGVYQDFYTRVFLSNFSASKIAWIGSFQLMMTFALGVVSGKLFDAGYFRAVETVGSVLYIVSLFCLSLTKSQHYAQVFLSQGVGMGIGMGLTLIPTIGLTVHHFPRRKVLATGIVMTGTSIGAVVFPIMINRLIISIGFPQAVRASAYLALGMLVAGNCLMKPAYSKTHVDGPKINPISFFADPPYIIASIGGICAMFGFYFPLIYLQLYAVTHGINTTLAFYSIAILNAASTFGRLLGNYLADVHGALNILIPCTVLTAASIFAMFGIHDSGSLVVVSIFYGLFAGAWLSLIMAGLATLARHPNEVGARTGISLAISSFASLGAAPIQGALLGPSFNWNKPIIFSGILMMATAVFYVIARQMLARERSTQRL